MAIIQSIQEHPLSGNSNFMRVTWSGLANGDTGSPFVLSQYADRSVQVEGTFGVGGAVVVEGSNEDALTNWRTLNDPFSNSINITTAKIEAVTELVFAIRPRVAAGDGTTLINITMLVRKNN